MIIAICGNSGSGKSTLARKIKEERENVIHCDIDHIGHEVLKYDEVKKKLAKTFGKEVIKDEEVDRKALGDIVFNSKEKMKKLTDITWESMQKEIDKIISTYHDSTILLDWILLYKTKYFCLCDLKVLLDIPYEVRKQRAIHRDGITEKKFDERKKAKVEYQLEDFDIVLDDNKNIERILKQL